MEKDGIVAGLIVLAIFGAILYVIYWVITMQMLTFELLFGNGWLFILFVVIGSILSMVNVPFYKVRSNAYLSLNLGGAGLPCLLSFYLLYFHWNSLNLIYLLLSLVITIIASRILSVYVSGIGVLGLVIAIEFLSVFIVHSLGGGIISKLVFAYIISTYGVLIGADILHLREITNDKKWKGTMSIGGAGIRDGVWSAGLVAMLILVILGW
jgi:uncharacterized membrane protein